MQNATERFDLLAEYAPVTVMHYTEPRSVHEAKLTICPCCKSAISVKIPIVDLNTNTVSWQGKSTKLTPQQAEFMQALLRRFPGTVDLATMIGALWGADEPGNVTTCARTVVCRLRRYIEPLGWTIKNYYGTNYRLEAVQ